VLSSKFSEKLRKLRVENDLTLDQLGEALGSSKAYVWQLENKKNARPSADLLLKIAATLKVDPEYLLDDSIEELAGKQRDETFFRKFQSLSEDDRLTIERIMSGFERKK
jgi:transcriptional regulator with XRE-family HTH domain